MGEMKCKKDAKLTEEEMIELKNMREALTKAVEEMKPEILNEIQDMLSNKRRIPLNRTHSNCKLFMKMMTMAIKMFNCSEGSSYLGVVKIRIKLRPEAVENDKNKLIKRGVIEVELWKGEYHAKIFALIDSGANISAVNSDMENYLEYKDLGLSNEEVTGSTGKVDKRIKKANMALTSDAGTTYTV